MVAPPVAVNVIEPAIVFPNQAPKQVAVMVRSEVGPKAGGLSGRTRWIAPADGRSNRIRRFNSRAAGQEQQFSLHGDSSGGREAGAL